MGDLDLYQRNDALPHSYTLKRDEPGFLAFLLLGLIAGAIAKLILPGKQGGGWIGGMLFGEGVDAFFSLSSWLLAIGGSLIVLLIWGFITSRGSKNKA